VSRGGGGGLSIPPLTVYASPCGLEQSVARQVHCMRWFTAPLGDDMDQINAYIFYTLGSRLQAVFLEGKFPIKVLSQDAQFSIAVLDLLLGGEAKFKLDDSAKAARVLRDYLAKLIELSAADSEALLDPQQLEMLNYAIRTFDASIALELGRAPIFAVAPRGVFDMRRLITDAPSVFEGYASRLPEKTIEETRVAGRCLAFSLWTAAGFHIARATEAVVKRQMEVFECPPIKKSQRNLGKYIEALEAKGAHPRVIQHLKRFKELHRNPLMHPDVTLSSPEGLSLWATCVSLIQAMVADMETKRDDPDPAIVAMLPPNVDDEE